MVVYGELLNHTHVTHYHNRTIIRNSPILSILQGEFHAGSLTAYMWPNGAGKTMQEMKTLAGLIKKDA